MWQHFEPCSYLLLGKAGKKQPVNPVREDSPTWVILNIQNKKKLNSRYLVVDIFNLILFNGMRKKCYRENVNQ